jgi:hypothetical protein
MLVVNYDPHNGHAVPDAKIKEFVKVAIETHEDLGNNVVEVGSELIIGEFRVAIIDGLIPHDQIVFRFEGQVIVPNEYARLPAWPQGFCDYGDTQCRHVLVAASRKLRQKED